MSEAEKCVRRLQTAALKDEKFNLRLLKLFYAGLLKDAKSNLLSKKSLRMRLRARFKFDNEFRNSDNRMELLDVKFFFIES